MIRWMQNVSKKWLMVTIAVIAVVAVAGVTFLNGGVGKPKQGAAGQPNQQQQRSGPRQFAVETQTVKMQDVGGGQVFTGSITPQYTTNVSSRVTGRVTDVMVKVGDYVKKGQPLAQIDTTQLQQQISQSQASLAVTAAQYEKAQSDQVNSIATTEKQLEVQKANLAKAIQDQQNSVAAAQQQVAVSQASYNKAVSDQMNTIATAKQTVALAQQTLNTQINTYNQNLATAQNTLSQQQDSLQGQTTTSSNSLQSRQLEVQQAAIAYQNALAKGDKAGIDSAIAKLQSAQLAYDQSQQAPTTALVNAQSALTKAEADLAAAQSSQIVQTAQEQLNRDLLTLTNAQNNLAIIMESNQQSLKKDQLSLQNTLASLETNLNVSKAQVAQTEQTLENNKSASLTVNDAQLQQAQNNLRVLEEQLQDGVLSSPVDGVVTSINTPIGQNAGNNGNIVSIAALDPVQASVSVSEANVGKIKIGMEMKVNVPTLGKSFDGVVTVIRPTLDSVTKSYGIDIKINDPKKELLPGMFASSSLKNEGRKAIMIPADAVISQPSGNAVFIVQEGKAKKVSVKVGALTSAMFEITSGLKEGDEVVVKGQEMLSDKAAVQVVQPGQEGSQQQGAGQKQQGQQNNQQNGQQNGQQKQNNQQNNQQRQQGQNQGQTPANGQTQQQGQGQRPAQGNAPANGTQGQAERAGGGQ
ncbi:efflux RND transporter periplasmic adaptor subunit [Paenibacillus allorhizosphaerae]|uniref:Multidrug resistance protein MdtA n=1 Tax=Paenibacillus allorhizosphaerae TaxID=2849866 RepID=A0ABN7TL64_9BACL|nr:efflux RND transporter periplasmic adaptor subunit [Paenibacillus allorhizosphaerae]CAG7635072.1 Multidrug resistance protein MdtA [Paenibacillus allorhizosphaerae]